MSDDQTDPRQLSLRDAGFSPKLVAKFREKEFFVLGDFVVHTSQSLYKKGIARLYFPLIRQTLKDHGLFLVAEVPLIRSKAETTDGNGKPRAFTRNNEFIEALLSGNPNKARWGFDQLVMANQPLVFSIAKQWDWVCKSDGVFGFDDLVQVGNEGLMRAIKKYKPEGGAFSTYATWWIRLFIQNLLSERGPVPLRISLSRKVSQLEKIIRETFIKEGEDEMTVLQKKMKTTQKDLRRYLKARETRKAIHISLDSFPENKDGGSRNQSLEAVALSEVSCFYNSREQESLQASMKAAVGVMMDLQVLTKREVQIIVGRFELNGKDFQTLEEIGNSLGISRERVRQLEVDALEKLRSAHSRRGFEGLILDELGEELPRYLQLEFLNAAYGSRMHDSNRTRPVGTSNDSPDDSVRKFANLSQEARARNSLSLTQQELSLLAHLYGWYGCPVTSVEAIIAKTGFAAETIEVMRRKAVNKLRAEDLWIETRKEKKKIVELPFLQTDKALPKRKNHWEYLYYLTSGQPFSYTELEFVAPQRVDWPFSWPQCWWIKDLQRALTGTDKWGFKLGDGNCFVHVGRKDRHSVWQCDRPRPEWIEKLSGWYGSEEEKQATIVYRTRQAERERLRSGGNQATSAPP